MNKTGWIIFSAVTVVILGGLVAWTRIANPPIDVSGVENNSVIAASDASGSIADHVKKGKNGTVTLVEYGDYQCPSCGSAFPGLQQLLEDRGDDLTFIFRNFPLTTMHPNARAAASAAEAAGLQGKYWEMHDILYKNQDEWSSLDTKQRTTVFTNYAETLKLDADTFTTDMASSAVSKKIAFDMAMGKKENIEGTPTFYLNGNVLDAQTANALIQGDTSAIEAKIDELLK